MEARHPGPIPRGNSKILLAALAVTVNSVPLLFDMFTQSTRDADIDLAEQGQNIFAKYHLAVIREMQDG